MIRRLTTLAFVFGLGTGLVAQSGTEPALRVHHSFPEAGEVLRIVVEGLVPDNPVEILLPEVTEAPPSVVSYLLDLNLIDLRPEEQVGVLRVVAQADEYGRLALAIPLVLPEDAERIFALLFFSGEGERRSAPLQLMVQPPTLLVPFGANGTDAGLHRIDLRDGMVLVPSIPGNGGLVAAGLSTDGLNGYILRARGLLETWSTLRWGGRPRTVRALDPATDDLAYGSAAGAFVVVRPDGGPFAPSARLVFLDGRHDDLLVEPMGQDVPGRRWAMADDGFTAFVAEDDLLVREIDLLGGNAHGVFAAGFPGDRAIADLAFQDGRLLVLTRQPEGRGGALTVLEMESGWLSVFPLTVDPLRLELLSEGRALVVPASGSDLELLVDGVPTAVFPTAVFPLDAGRVVDAAAVPGGALLLVAEGADDAAPDGHRLDFWSAEWGILPFLQQEDGVPAARRLVSAGKDVAVLLGAPDGLLYRVQPSTGILEQIPDVTTAPDTPFAVLP